MSAIKDIVDLAKDLESRAKDRRDIEVLRQIHSLAFSLQSQQSEIVERNVRLIQENAELKRQLSEAQAEEIRIHLMVEFRRGKRTSGEWMAFCPKCHLPAGEKPGSKGLRVASCSGFCGWSASIPASLASIIEELGA